MPLRARRGPALLALALFAALLLAWARPALAWVDLTIEGDDARVTLQPNGAARVEHRITLKIAGGPLRALDLRGVDRNAVPELDGYIVPLREANQHSLASAVPITVELMPPGNKPEPDGSPALSSLKIRFQNEKGIGRGVYVVLLRYTTNLANRITADGAMARVVWKGPLWDYGLDSVRVTFELPAAPSEPRVADSPTRAQEPADPRAAGPLILSTVKRGLKTDSIELLRPYVPKGEAPIWAIHANLRALTVTTPRRSQPAPSLNPGGSTITAPAFRTLGLACAAALFLLYSVLCALKSSEVAKAATAAGATARPVIALPAPLRAVLAGASLVGGLWVELVAQKATLGALLGARRLAARGAPPAALEAGLGAPPWPGALAPRGRGAGLSRSAAAAGGWLDASTRPGKVMLLLALAALGAGVAALNEISTYQAQLVAFDATALLAVFCTGLRSGLPPDPGQAPTRFLREVARRVRKALPKDELRIIGRIRVPEGSAEPDELRLSIAPGLHSRGSGRLRSGWFMCRGRAGPSGCPRRCFALPKGRFARGRSRSSPRSGAPLVGVGPRSG